MAYREESAREISRADRGDRTQRGGQRLKEGIRKDLLEMTSRK